MSFVASIAAAARRPALPEAETDAETETGIRPPKVSVLIPAWRAERWLERAARSALAQEGVSLEVIVIDDASPDGTAALTERLAAADPRLRLVRGTVNRGPGVSRDLGAKAARGRWIAFLDADDAFAPGRLARLVRRAEAEGLDALADLPSFHDLAADEAASVQLPADGRLEILALRGLLESAALPGAPLDYGMLKGVVRRDLFLSGVWRHPENVRHGEDFLALADALAAGIRFGVLHERGYVLSTRIGEKSGAFSPGSVTPVNYRAMAADARRLAGRLALARPEAADLGPEEIARLTRLRVARCADLNARYGWNTLRKRAWGRHLRWLAQDPRNPPLLLALAAGKAGRAFMRACGLAGPARAGT